MIHILAAVVAYLLFNVAVWLAIAEGGLLALGGANILGGLVTITYFRKEVRGRGRPSLFKAGLGAAGILFIVFGLRNAHAGLPVSLSMEAVYNTFAIISWPLFVALNMRWPRQFTERPNWFDLGCHFAMAGLVILRFYTYGSYTISMGTAAWIGMAVLGYVLFNVSIKVASGHRATNVTMNLIGGVLLVGFALLSGDSGHWQWSVNHAGGLLLGGAAIFFIVRELGASYGYFGSRGKASLVAPLVYDGILVASPVVMIATGEWQAISFATVFVALGMLTVTYIRYRHHSPAPSIY